MSLLCTFPGRYGDILWALPTVRAISQAAGEPVDLLIAGEFASLVPILRAPYLRDVYAEPSWALTPPNEWVPPLERGYLRYEEYDRVVHCGYRGWPSEPLPQFVWQQTRREYPGVPLAPLDLETPWLEIDGPGAPTEIAVGFTEAWFELKLGLLACVMRDDEWPYLQLTPPGSRWVLETPPGMVAVHSCNWLEATRVIRNADLFFGDCSALHVLACALGKRCVIMEPMEGRHNSVFWPYGTEGRVRLVLGGDGQPTFDARHCRDAIAEARARVGGR